MPLEHHPLVKEFSNLHDRIHELKMNDNHFSKMMEQYEVLDKEIYRAESDEEPTTDEHLKELRSRRVHLKDEIYAYLQK